jgi:ribosome-interacting GTPase 1
LVGNSSVNKFPQQSTHVNAVTDTHTTIEELLEAVFSVGSVHRIYQENKRNASTERPTLPLMEEEAPFLKNVYV